MGNFARFWETGRKAVAIGRNYAAHAKELGNAVNPTPFWFIKPTSSYIGEGNSVMIPPGLDEIDYEVELAVVIGQKASRMTASQAMDCVGGYCLTIDMTARKWQKEAKEKRLPWTAAKAFDTSMPYSRFIGVDEITDPHNLTLWLKVNGEQKQHGFSRDMIFRIPELIEAVSSVHTLEPGDLVLTGTPEGVGPVRRGDTMTAGIAELELSMTFPVE